MLKKVFYLFTIFISQGCGTASMFQKPASLNFSKDQAQLVLTGSYNEPMRVFKITNYQDSILLRTSCENVVIDTENHLLDLFTKRLYATVRDSLSMGVGIAAPQVGILKNIIWVQRFDKQNLPFEVYYNPIIKKYSKKKQACPEGCLSIPGVRDTTRDRSYAILIEYDKPDGTHHYEMVEGFTAVIFQHEIDHLNGILFLDHLAKEMEDAKNK